MRKKTSLWQRFLALAVSMSIILTVGSTVLAENSGSLTPGTSVTTVSGINYSSRYYYTFTPETTGT